MRSEGRRLGLTSLERAEDQVLLHLYRATGGAPLAIKWAVGQIGQRGQSLDTVLETLYGATGDIFVRIFTRSWGLLSASARQVLVIMPLFATSASRAGIEAAGDLHHFVLDEALGQLVQMSLIDATDEVELAQRRYSIHPLTRAFASAKPHRELEMQAFERILVYYKQFVTPPKRLEVGVPYWDYLLFDRTWAQSLEREWDNLDFVIHRALNEGRNTAVLELFLPVVHFMNVWGLWDKRLRLSRDICRVAGRLGDPSEAWLWVDAMGHILSHQQQITEWEEVLENGRAAAERFGLTDALILADASKALLHARKGEDNCAIEEIESVLKHVQVDSVLGREKVHQIVVARALAMAGWIYQSNGQFTRAKELFERELELRRSIGENPAPVLSRLGFLSLRLGDNQSAGELLNQAKKIAGPKDLAGVNYGLALVAERKGDTQEARYLGELALEQFARFGREGYMRRCKELLERLPL